MDVNQLEQRVAMLENLVASQAHELERLDSIRQITNLISKYEQLHSAHRWEEQLECFALKTPGLRCVFNGNVYEGEEGVRNHYTGLLKAAEQNLSGRIYAHEMGTPTFEVARDNMSAKAYFSSIGFETLVTPDGVRKSLWSYAKFRMGFVKEEGEWKIYRFDMHGVLNTPFDGAGWAVDPYLVGFASGDTDNLDPRWAPNAIINRDEDGNPLYIPLQPDTPYCDLHNLQPDLIEPYETWDEGTNELYQDCHSEQQPIARKVDPEATCKRAKFRSVARPDEYPKI